MIKGKQIEDYSIPLSKLEAQIEQGARNYNGDYDLIPTPTNGDGSSTGLSPSQDPAEDSAFYVLVNGIQIDLGDGDKIGEGYFSIDGGTTAQTITDITTDSVLYWNPSVSFFEMDANDRVTFIYEIGGLMAENPSTSGTDSPTTNSFSCFQFVVGRGDSTTDSFLEDHFGNPTNLSPEVIPFDARIISITAVSQATETWSAVVFVNDVEITAATLNVVNARSAYADFNVLVSAGDLLSVYCEGTLVTSPKVIVYLERLV